MKKIKAAFAATLLTLSMVSGLALAGCGQVEQAANEAAQAAADVVSQFLEGDVTGEVGKEYNTQWFTFTVDSMTTGTEYEGYTAEAGNILLIAHITEKNTSGQSQPFGTFDWFVDDSTLLDYIYPLDPTNDKMMPDSFTLADGEEASYDVIIEYPDNLAAPALTYVEVDNEETAYTTFSIPIK